MLILCPINRRGFTVFHQSINTTLLINKKKEENTHYLLPCFRRISGKTVCQLHRILSVLLRSHDTLVSVFNNLCSNPLRCAAWRNKIVRSIATGSNVAFLSRNPSLRISRMMYRDGFEKHTARRPARMRCRYAWSTRLVVVDMADLSLL